MEDYSQYLKGNARQDYKDARNNGQMDTFINSAVLQSKDLELVFREMDRLKTSELEAREEVLEMQNLMRK